MIRVEETCLTEIRTRANELNGSRTIFAQTFAIDLDAPEPEAMRTQVWLL